MAYENELSKYMRQQQATTAKNAYFNPRSKKGFLFA